MLLWFERSVTVRSNEELMKGILQRKAVYLLRRQSRRLTAAGAGLAALLLAALLLAPGIRGAAVPQQPTVLGATILGPEAGGYVIVALLAFALGIVITLLAQNRRKQAERDGDAGHTEKRTHP